ncbi:MAG: PD40 domain-containing protein [Elusimicrobiales bacterium]|nr:PD40 domain-containing protein [Elusimicrobiales bacterium]
MIKICLTALLTILSLSSAYGETSIYIGVSPDKEYRKTNLALAQFLPINTKSKEDLRVAAEIRDIVREDLMRSRYFDLQESPLSLANIFINKKTLSYWSKLGSDYFITAKASSTGAVWTLKAQIYKLADKKLLIEKHYHGEMRGLRRGAHLFSDDIVKEITGKVGIAHSKIAFSNNSTKHKEIFIIDYDGENLLKLTNTRSINLLPRWSHDGNKIYYTSYKYLNPDMFEIDLLAGKIKPYITFQGLNIPGGNSPDGNKMVMTLSMGKNPNIYLLNKETRKLKKLLKNFSLASSPTYSPDGKQIAFVSDRSGNPQLYVLNLETGKTRKLTRFNWCDSPAWSPTGEWIAFAGRKSRKEKMNIFLTDLTGNIKHRLTINSGSNENPSWSPDGRFLVFSSTRNKKKELFIMDVDGSAQHLLTEIDGHSYTPHWSP